MEKMKVEDFFFEFCNRKENMEEGDKPISREEFDEDNADAPEEWNLISKMLEEFAEIRIREKIGILNAGENI